MKERLTMAEVLAATCKDIICGREANETGFCDRHDPRVARRQINVIGSLVFILGIIAVNVGIFTLWTSVTIGIAVILSGIGIVALSEIIYLLQRILHRLL